MTFVRIALSGQKKLIKNNLNRILKTIFENLWEYIFLR